LYDADTPHDNLSFIVFSIPYSGSLYFLNGTSAGDKITKSNTVIPMSGKYCYCDLASGKWDKLYSFPDDGLWRIVFKPAEGASGTDYASFFVIGFDGILDSARYE
jgi:hypothetical protein